MADVWCSRTWTTRLVLWGLTAGLTWAKICFVSNASIIACPQAVLP